MADFLAADFNYPDFDTGSTQNIAPALTQQLAAGINPTVALDTQDIAPVLIQQLAVGVDPTVFNLTQTIIPTLVQQLTVGVDPTVSAPGLLFVGWGIPV